MAVFQKKKQIKRISKSNLNKNLKYSIPCLLIKMKVNQFYIYNHEIKIKNELEKIKAKNSTNS